VIPRGAEPAATLRIVDRAGATVLAIPAEVEGAGDKLRASAVLKPRLLPAGDLAVVGEIAIGGKAAAERRRAFVVRGAGGTGAAAGGATLASVVPDVSGLAPRFAREAVLESPLLGRAFTALEARKPSPAARAAIERARAGDRSAPDAALVRADAVTGAFLAGLADLGSVNLAPDPAARATARADLERAAQRFREALRADADFLPAAVFLGACYALGGRDQEAAGAWQTALIGIDDEPALFALIVDARLRAGDAAGAAELMGEAEGRWPADATLKPRRVLVDLSQGRVAEALTALDALERPSADMLFAAMRILYGAHAAGLAVEDSSRDKARLERYAEQYAALGGPDQALVKGWITAFK
jgi:tetratricopeptide (TPR) repeat protein